MDDYAAYLANDLAKTLKERDDALAELAAERARRLQEGRDLTARHQRASDGLRERLTLAEQARDNLSGLLRRASDERDSLRAQLDAEADRKTALRRAARLLEHAVTGDGDQIDLENALRALQTALQQAPAGD